MALGIFQLNQHILRRLMRVYIKFGFIALYAGAGLFTVTIFGPPILMGLLTSYLMGTTKGWPVIVFFTFLLVVTLPLLPSYFASIFMLQERVLMAVGIYSFFGFSPYAYRDKLCRKLKINPLEVED
jgi:hypothetical protein